MARSRNFASLSGYCNYYNYYDYLLLLAVLIVVWGLQSCDAFGTFGFDIHHRYSDPVKGVLGLDGLPEKGTLNYYAALAHRDHLLRGRKLASATANSTPLTFIAGNETRRESGLGFLHYANVSVGTPGLWFFVALDTGSDLFWLPCNCTGCVPGLVTRSNQKIDLNVYFPNTSSTSSRVSCNSTFCGQQSQCSTPNTCAYQIEYLSNDTSSTGILVEDFLHLTTDDSQLKAVNAKITFGCGLAQTGSFLNGAAPDGLFGLGMGKISVPSILSSQGLTANSFSMCFGPNGIGRISFGDTGSTEQGETPFNLIQSHPSYNVSITQISVDNNVTDVSFSAIFDSGTSFTTLTDPAYTIISEGFNSLAQETRHPSDPNIPFEYCYDLRSVQPGKPRLTLLLGNSPLEPQDSVFLAYSANQKSFDLPKVNLTMKGGTQFNVTDPIVLFSVPSTGYVYCLAVVKSGDINIIGQNFMTGNRIIFNHDKMVLGWEASDCFDAEASSLLPINPIHALPPTATEPEATSGAGNGSAFPSPPPSNSPRLNSFTSTPFMVFLALLFHIHIIRSS